MLSWTQRSVNGLFRITYQIQRLKSERQCATLQFKSSKQWTTFFIEANALFLSIVWFATRQTFKHKIGTHPFNVYVLQIQIRTHFVPVRKFRLEVSNNKVLQKAQYCLASQNATFCQLQRNVLEIHLPSGISSFQLQ